MTYMKLDGKVAVVTGSSRGIGKAVAMALARNGAFIVLNGRNEARLLEAELALKEIHQNIHSVCCDLSTTEGGAFLVSETLRMFGKIDILVNNAGVSMRGRVAGLNPEVFRTVFNDNVMSAVSATIPSLEHIRQTGGSVVFVSSLAGIRGLPLLSSYSAAKMALRALAETIRIEEAPYGIHVGLIYVGMTVNEEGKETIAADGSKIPLQPRSGKGVLTMESVAKALLQNIRKRKFITVMTAMGRLNYLLQSLVPSLVEWIIIKNIRKFEENSK